MLTKKTQEIQPSQIWWVLNITSILISPSILFKVLVLSWLICSRLVKMSESCSERPNGHRSTFKPTDDDCLLLNDDLLNRSSSANDDELLDGNQNYSIRELMVQRPRNIEALACTCLRCYFFRWRQRRLFPVTHAWHRGRRAVNTGARDRWNWRKTKRIHRKVLWRVSSHILYIRRSHLSSLRFTWLPQLLLILTGKHSLFLGLASV